MAAGNYDITIDEGSDFELTMVVKDGNDPRQLQGWSARGHLRQSKDTAQYWAFTFNTLANDGTIVMSLPYNVVDNHGHAALTAGNYFYDVEIYQGTTAVERILQGKAVVTREVTR